MEHTTDTLLAYDPSTRERTGQWIEVLDQSKGKYVPHCRKCGWKGISRDTMGAAQRGCSTHRRLRGCAR